MNFNAGTVLSKQPAPWMPFFDVFSPEADIKNPSETHFSSGWLDVYCSSTNFGEIMLWSPLMNATPTRLTFLNTEANKRVAPLLDGLGLIRFADSIPYDTENILPYRGMHFPKRILMTFGLGNYSCLPRIKLRPDELAQAHQLVTRYHNPVCIRDVQVKATGDRQAPDGFFQRIVDTNPDYTFISFGLSKNHPYGATNFTQLNDNVVKIDDLPVRLVAACHYWISRWVGVDSGAGYLMMACGGKCDIFCPPVRNPQGYAPYLSWVPQEEWGTGENQRINYLRFDEVKPRSVLGLDYSGLGGGL